MVSTSPLPSSKNGWKAAPVRTFEGHENAILSVAWYPDERRIVSASYDGELRIWDTETSSQVGEAIRGHVRSVWTLYVSPDGTMIASGGRDTTVRLWHSETGAPIHICEGHKDAIRDVHFSPDSTRVVSVSQDHTMRIWDVKTGELVCEPVKCKGGPVYAVRYSPNGDRIATGGCSIQIWNVLESGVDLVLSVEGDAWSLAWTYDGERLVTGGTRKITVWNTSSGEQIHTWEAHERWIRVWVSPTTTHVATCDTDIH